jgi:ABC-2 type transport system ATP-binding protein
MPVLRVAELSKTYRIPIKEPGFVGSLRSLFSRETREVRAVDGVSFSVEAGERVGFLGPNGAGKTTTLKMLCGLLWPTSGTAEVAGFAPQNRESDFLRSITLVMGQKQQLLWDLPAHETFALNRALFDLPWSTYQESMSELTKLLDLEKFLDQPVRSLSLGQRMRCELAAALLHRPKVLFLDEPTIGMDVEVQALVRQFVADYNRRYEATVMLTSHDMMDVAELCRRIILIDKGVVRFDGTIEGFVAKFAPGREVRVTAGDDLGPLGFVKSEDKYVATVAANEVNPLLAEVLRRHPNADVTVSDPPLEAVLRKAFGETA